MKTLEEIKEEALKKVAKTMKSWLKLEIGFAQAHKEVGDAIESTISQTKQELIEEIKKEVYKIKRSYEGLYPDAPDVSESLLEVSLMLQKLSNK